MNSELSKQRFFTFPGISFLRDVSCQAYLEEYIKPFLNIPWITAPETSKGSAPIQFNKAIIFFDQTSGLDEIYQKALNLNVEESINNASHLIILLNNSGNNTLFHFKKEIIIYEIGILEKNSDQNLKSLIKKHYNSNSESLSDNCSSTELMDQLSHDTRSFLVSASSMLRGRVVDEEEKQKYFQKLLSSFESNLIKHEEYFSFKRKLNESLSFQAKSFFNSMSSEISPVYKVTEELDDTEILFNPMHFKTMLLNIAKLMPEPEIKLKGLKNKKIFQFCSKALSEKLEKAPHLKAQVNSAFALIKRICEANQANLGIYILNPTEILLEIYIETIKVKRS